MHAISWAVPSGGWQNKDRHRAGRKDRRGKGMNIYVGNLNYSTTEDSIRGLFQPHGEVASVNIITFRDTGRSRGFGFVEMPNEKEARAAIATLGGAELDGNALTVNEARPKTERRDRSYNKQDRW
jgi:RNA recognition motif-containing protein